MTRINLEALETLLAAGTPGEWRHAHHGACEVEAGENRLVADCGARELGGHADASAIVALHNAAPALIAEIRALRDALDDADARLDAEREARMTSQSAAKHLLDNANVAGERKDCEIRALREVAEAARSLCQADSDMSNESRGTRRARLSREEPNRWGALRAALAKVSP